MIDELDHTPASPEQLAACTSLIDAWLTDEQANNPFVAAVERIAVENRWLVRLHGEEKEFTTVWFTLGQRTLQFETYVMPAPEENPAELYEYLLRRNRTLNGVAFDIGDEDAVFLRGRLAVGFVDRAELDRVLGTLYATVERFFKPAMRIGYASRFRG